jgi:hypothetical protein
MSTGPIPCAAQLGYTKAEPLAVTIDFAWSMPLDGRPVRWCFARDLLAQGVSRASGQGDVRIGPLGSQHTLLELRSHLATATLTCPTAALEDFLGSDRNSLNDLEAARPGATHPEPPGWMTA